MILTRDKITFSNKTFQETPVLPSQCDVPGPDQALATMAHAPSRPRHERDCGAGRPEGRPDD